MGIGTSHPLRVTSHESRVTFNKLGRDDHLAEHFTAFDETQAFHRLRTIPGVGKVAALTILYEIHDVHRFDRVQQFASYARLVKCAKESAGKKLGTSGAKMGNVHLKWAFSEAAVLFVRHSAEGKKLLARLEKRFGKGKALSILAHKLGRAAYFMLAREKAFDAKRFAATVS